MVRGIMRALLAASLMSAEGFAQSGPPPGPPGPPGPLARFGLRGPFGPGGGAEIHPWKVVTNAPYSATMTEQSVETLPNNAGTITHSTTGTVARDKYGRSYVQQTFTNGPFGSQNGPKTIIFITDPVAGYNYTLLPDRNLAIQRPFRTPPEAGGSPAAHPHPTDANVTVTTSSSTYQSLPVTVTTTTRTIPANTMGNSAALTSTSNVTYSPDLQVVVSSTRSDPRFGQSTYTLTNIVPGDPTSVSFSVPAGYTVQTASPFGHRGLGGPR